jgi:hypothetical protein
MPKQGCPECAAKARVQRAIRLYRAIAETGRASLDPNGSAALSRFAGRLPFPVQDWGLSRESTNACPTAVGPAIRPQDAK